MNTAGRPARQAALPRPQSERRIDQLSRRDPLQRGYRAVAASWLSGRFFPRSLAAAGVARGAAPVRRQSRTGAARRGFSARVPLCGRPPRQARSGQLRRIRVGGCPWPAAAARSNSARVAPSASSRTICLWLGPNSMPSGSAKTRLPAPSQDWFAGVMSGPLVRSSYRAGRLYGAGHRAASRCASLCLPREKPLFRRVTSVSRPVRPGRSRSSRRALRNAACDEPGSVPQCPGAGRAARQ
jgi:hypothetical protein